MQAIDTRFDIAQDIAQKLLHHEMKLSYTALTNFMSSPKDFIEYKLKVVQPTDAMIYGSMLHCLILEPQDFENRYFTFDDTDKCASIGGEKPRATKAYKEWKADTILSAGDRIVVSPDDYKYANLVALNVKYNRASAKIMDKCPIHERPVDWEFMNFLWHGFIDGDGEDYMFDIKSMPDSDPKSVQREIVSRKLYLQGAMYLYGTQSMKRYHIIAVDKLGGVSVHEIEERLLKQGMTEYRNAVEKFNDCILKDAWDQSHDFWAERWDGIYTAEKPGWMY